MTDRPFRHRVERTRNKHSRAVFREGTIIIRLAKNLTQHEEEQHIDSLLQRMQKILKIEHESKILIDPFRSLLKGAESVNIKLPRGKKYTFILQAGTRQKVQRTRTGWIVTVSPSMRRSGLHKLLWKKLAEAERPRIEKLMHEINRATLRVRVTKFSFAFATSQWGSCSPKGRIMINAALLFAPQRLMEYVIVHELAHRKRGDHSPKYWQIVERAMPGYRKERKALLDYRLPSL